jgi:hypothetical protein
VDEVQFPQEAGQVTHYYKSLFDEVLVETFELAFDDELLEELFETTDELV